MIYLDDKLPTSIELGEVVYPLDLSFNNVISALRPLKDPELMAMDKVELFLTIIMVDDPPEVELWQELMTEINEVIRSEPIVPIKRDQNGDPMPVNPDNDKPDFDFDFDARYIYSAFLQTYGIDLYDQQGKLHWLKFVSLLNALPEDTMFRQIRQIRSTKVSKIKDKEQRNQLLKQKEMFKLPDSDGEEVEDYGG